MERLRSVLYATALEKVRDAELAMEMTQAALIRGFLKIDQLKEPKALFRWMQQIVTRLCLNTLSRRKDHTMDAELLAIIPEKQASDVTDAMVESEEALFLRAQVKNLSKMDREAIRQFYFENLSIQEIAEKEEIPEGTVKRRLHVARKRLKTRLEGTLYFQKEFEAPFSGGISAMTKKLATVSKTTRVAGMSKNTFGIATEDTVLAAFKSEAKRVIGTSPANTFGELKTLVDRLGEEDGDRHFKGQYGKQFLQVLHTHARKVHALLNPSSNGTHLETEKRTLMQEVIGGAKQIADLTQAECATLSEEIMYTGEFHENLDALKIKEEDFAKLCERATAPTNSSAVITAPPPPTQDNAQSSPDTDLIQQTAAGNDVQPVVPAAHNPGDDTDLVRKDDADHPPTEAEHIADSLEGTKAFMIAYVLAGQYSPAPEKAREELCEIFGVNTESIDQFDLDEYARRLNVPPPNPQAQRLHRPAELKQALRILCKNEEWRLPRSMSRIGACFGLSSGNAQGWADAQEEFLDLSGKKFTVPVKPKQTVESQNGKLDAQSPTPPEGPVVDAKILPPVGEPGNAQDKLPEPPERLEPAQAPDVLMQQLTAENQELKTRNEKLTASVELLGKEIQALRTQIDQALVRAPQQSPTTQVIEVSPDGTTKNVVRITVEVALAQQK